MVEGTAAVSAAAIIVELSLPDSRTSYLQLPICSCAFPRKFIYREPFLDSFGGWAYYEKYEVREMGDGGGAPRLPLTKHGIKRAIRWFTERSFVCM